jgi:hypothetical protein
MSRKIVMCFALATLGYAVAAAAQAPSSPPPYGAPIDLGQAKRAAAAAVAEVAKSALPPMRSRSSITAAS